jgi:hypothetical protein
MWITTQRTTDDVSRINVVGRSLEDSARDWFYTLNIGGGGTNSGARIDSFEQFRRAFLERFQKTIPDRWRLVQEVWEMRQSENQSTETFASEVNRKGVKAALTPDQILLAVRSGLRDDIKSAIMQHPEIETISDIVKWGTIAERYPQQNSGLTRELVETIRRIEETMHKAKFRPLVSTQPEESQTFQGGGNVCSQDTQSGSRDENSGDGRCGDYNNEYQSINEYQQNFRPNGFQRNYQNRTYQSGNGNNRGYQGGSYNRGYQNNGNNNGFQGRSSFRSENYRSSGRFSAPNQAESGESEAAPCSNCGFSNHRREICPAREADCRKCYKRGHFARMCRSVPGPPTPQN